MEITIHVQAPELANAIGSLAAALQGANLPPVNPPPPATPPTAASTVLPPAATYATAAPAAPSASAVPDPAPAAPPPAVPVAPPPTYTREQIMVAGSALVDAGKIGELMKLLEAFGVQAVTHLKPEQLGPFATELRKMGAQI